MKQGGVLSQLTVLLILMATSQVGSPRTRTVRVSGNVSRNASVKVATKITLKGQTKGAKSVSTSIQADDSFVFESVASGTYLIELQPSPDKGLRALHVGSQNISDIAIPEFIPTFEVAGTLPTVQEISGILPPGNRLSDSFGPNIVLENTDRSKPSFEFLQISRYVIPPADGYFVPKKQFGDKLSRKGEFKFLDVAEGKYILNLMIGSGDVCCTSVPTGTFVTVRDRNVALGTVRLQGLVIP